MKTFEDYKELALRTESTKLPLTEETVTRGLSNRLFHAILGIQTEINEIYDAIEDKNYTDYDIVNILEEFGDMSWYLAIACDDRKLVIDFNVAAIDERYIVENFKIKEIRQIESELLDHSKKVMFYGKQLDEKLVDAGVKELLNLVFNSILSLQGNIKNVLQANILKLKARYPDSFSDFHAENRDLVKEREILEDNSK